MTQGKRGAPGVAPRLQWTARALADLTDIEEYIAADDPAAAERWVARILGKAEAAARMPLAGRVVPEKAHPDVREVFLRRYRIVYRTRAAGIVVLTVFEGHRLFPRGVDIDVDDET